VYTLSCTTPLLPPSSDNEARSFAVTDFAIKLADKLVINDSASRKSGLNNSRRDFLTILDFGCGKGESYISKMEEVVGIDVKLSSLTNAKSRIQVVRCDGTRLPFVRSTFDQIVVDSVLEHIENNRMALREIRRVLAVEGTCRILQPVDNDPIFFFARRIARSWHGDPIRSRFNSYYLIRLITSSCLTILSTTYLPNAPLAGCFGFFGKRPPNFLAKIDRLYAFFSVKLTNFHWMVIIEATHRPVPDRSR
jgi:SAM-dependent methyltransferase